ncbi:MAG: hypothetical protein ABIJ97_06790, partial [Bacteroidota bacterium]
MNVEKRILFKKGSATCEFGSIGEEDVTEDYVKGLQQQKNYIENTRVDITLKKQRDYVKKIELSINDCIFGLYVNSSLIGTSGAQNIIEPGHTTIGIFIFNKT